MTPYEMTIMLHHYGSLAAFPRPNAPLYWPTIDKMIADGLLEISNGEGVPSATQKGAALVRLWASTPTPELSFIDPRTGEVIK